MHFKSPTVLFPVWNSATVALTRDNGRQILLHYRRNTSSLRGFWGMPGGKEERDKKGRVVRSAFETMLQELFEETGVDLRTSPVADQFWFYKPVLEPSEKGLFVCSVFIGELPEHYQLKNDERDNDGNLKHDDAVAFNVKDIIIDDENGDVLPGYGKVLLLPGVREAVRKLQAILEDDAELRSA